MVARRTILKIALIDGLNPDFQCVSDPNVFIDLWGDYWHRGQDPRKRIKRFARHGKLLTVLWESEVLEFVA